MPGAVLAKVDRMSMQHSLEVRAPLIGIEVADFAKRLAADDCYAAGKRQSFLKKVASRYLPEEWMNTAEARLRTTHGSVGRPSKLLPAQRRNLIGDAANARLTGMD